MAAGITTGLLFSGASLARATTFTFDNITNNDVIDAAIGEAQLSVDVTAVVGDPSQVQFTFNNVGPDALSITDIYFDDGALLGIASVNDNPPLVDFEEDASPGNLPGGNELDDPFVTTQGFSAESSPPTQPNGVNPGESLVIVFDLKPGKTFADVLADLQNGDLRIGLHVQGYESGGSESYVNRVSEPASLTMAGLVLAGLAWLRRRPSL